MSHASCCCCCCVRVHLINPPVLLRFITITIISKTSSISAKEETNLSPPSPPPLLPSSSPSLSPNLVPLKCCWQEERKKKKSTPLQEFILKHLLMADCLLQQRSEENIKFYLQSCEKTCFCCKQAKQPLSSWHGDAPDTEFPSREVKGEAPPQLCTRFFFLPFLSNSYWTPSRTCRKSLRIHSLSLSISAEKAHEFKSPEFKRPCP